MTQEPAVHKSAPRCYRHPSVETWVSCGRCGKPLCPDCVRHGPVGVRCDDCLRPQRNDLAINAPEHVGLALAVGSGEAFAWTILLVLAGHYTGVYSANLFIAALAGAAVGATIWRLCGRTSNSLTRRTGVLLGLAMPLLASLALAVISIVSEGMPDAATWLKLGVRAVVATAASLLFAWLLVSRR